MKIILKNFLASAGLLILVIGATTSLTACEQLAKNDLAAQAPPPTAGPNQPNVVPGMIRQLVQQKLGGDEICVLDNAGNYRCLKVSAAVKTWSTPPVLDRLHFKQIAANSFGLTMEGAIIDLASGTVVDPGVKYSYLASDTYAQDFLYTQVCGITQPAGALKCWWRLGFSAPTGPGQVYDDGTRYVEVSIGNAGPKSFGGDGYGSIRGGLCALKDDNSVMCVDSQGNRVASGLTNVSYVDGWDTVDCALDKDSQQVSCWGGLGSLFSNAGNQQKYTQFATGTDAACGVTVTNQIQCWGSSTVFSPSNTPPVSGPVTIDPNTSYREVLILERPDFWTSNGFTACGLSTDNIVRCWGPTVPVTEMGRTDMVPHLLSDSQ